MDYASLLSKLWYDMMIWYDIMIWHDIYDILYTIYDIWYDYVMIYAMIWRDVKWCDVMWCGVMWYMIWFDMIWYDMIWYDMLWYDMIWYMIYDMIYDDMIYDIWSDLINDMIWYMIYDMIWYDIIWYDMDTFCEQMCVGFMFVYVCDDMNLRQLKSTLHNRVYHQVWQLAREFSAQVSLDIMKYVTKTK